MSKLSAYDFKKESINQRDFNDDLTRLWNNSLYELKIISTSQPNWTEDISGIPVLSTYGTARLYISNIDAANKWSYVDLTDL